MTITKTVKLIGQTVTPKKENIDLLTATLDEANETLVLDSTSKEVVTDITVEPILKEVRAKSEELGARKKQ